MRSGIYFFKEGVKFKFLKREHVVRWVKRVIRFEGGKCGVINVVFCSDKYLLGLNKRFLNRDYFTDIITFDTSAKGVISGEIYISIDRVIENAKNLKLSFRSELNRVIIHGILHLLGYDDSTNAQKEEMRIKEDACLSLLPSFT